MTVRPGALAEVAACVISWAADVLVRVGTPAGAGVSVPETRVVSAATVCAAAVLINASWLIPPSLVGNPGKLQAASPVTEKINIAAFVSLVNIVRYSFSYGTPSAAGIWLRPIIPAKTIMVAI